MYGWEKKKNICNLIVYSLTRNPNRDTSVAMETSETQTAWYKTDVSRYDGTLMLSNRVCSVKFATYDMKI